MALLTHLTKEVNLKSISSFQMIILSTLPPLTLSLESTILTSARMGKYAWIYSTLNGLLLSQSLNCCCPFNLFWLIPTLTILCNLKSQSSIEMIKIAMMSWLVNLHSNMQKKNEYIIKLFSSGVLGELQFFLNCCLLRTCLNLSLLSRSYFCIQMRRYRHCHFSLERSSTSALRTLEIWWLSISHDTFIKQTVSSASSTVTSSAYTSSSCYATSVGYTQTVRCNALSLETERCTFNRWVLLWHTLMQIKTNLAELRVLILH